ncbi:MAG TPA: transcription antitermination factor NusB [Parachlamydiaceae bacterium]|nr:transcription antitermination factor NusB [Parachlamydiaceae bacterium]
MAVPQEKQREIVFQMLYGYDVGRANEEELVNLLMKELSVTKKAVLDAQDRVRHIAAILPELDQMIQAASKSYQFGRISTVERNILRLGLFETFFDDQIPVKVAISEAIRLTRKFGTPESAGFVNAILDSLHKISQGKYVDVDQVTKSIQDLNRSEEIAEQAALDKQKEQPEK